MKKISEKEFINILKTMVGKKVYIQMNGTIRIRKVINDLECTIKNNLITLFDNTTNEYVLFDLNEAYKTMSNNTSDKLQVNIDSLDNDTVLIITI